MSVSSGYPLVSVIVPAYNVEDYIADCLKALLAQDYPNLEIIVVDDGSTDRTGEILMEFARRDSRIKVLRQANAGPSEARNAGIMLASGEYLAFIDSDDLVGSCYVSYLVRIISVSKADIAVVGFRMFDGTASFADSCGKKDEWSLMTPETGTMKMLYQTSVIEPSPWGKLFSVRLWGSESRFVPGIIYEDLDLMPRIFLKAKSIAVSEEKLYFYRQREGSFMHRFEPRRLDVLGVTERLEKFMSEVNPDLGRAARDRRLSASFNIFGLCAASGDRMWSSVMDQCWELIRKYRWDSLKNPKVRLKNKFGIAVSYLGGKPLLRFVSRLVYKV